MTLGIEELIKPRSGFQTSVNLAYDLERADKIKDFVPTKATMKVLEKLMLPTAPGASERAHILIGAYGKGKSHLVLVLLAMMAKRHKEELAPVVRAMLEYKEELGRFAEEQLLGEGQQPLLPVVIDGSQGSLSQAFLSALQGTLSQAGMEDLMPETHFEAAIKQIELWEKDFPEPYRGQIRFVCLIFTEAYIRSRYDTIMRNANAIENRGADADVDLALLLEENRTYQRMFCNAPGATVIRDFNEAEMARL